MSREPETPWSVRFRRERQAAWVELEDLVSRCERGGLAALRPEQLSRLPVLYRAALSSLGVARASVLDQGLRLHLESLVARAYLVVYSPKRSLLEVLVPFATTGFPRAVRAIRWHVLVSAAVLLLGGALAWAMYGVDPEHYYLFVDGGMAAGRDPTASTEALRETLFGDDDGDLLAFASMLFTNNSSVGILTYGLGFVFGLPVVLLLLYNGMLLGAMSALFHERGLGVEWWSWVLPHGVTELLAIVLCGAAGLAVGQQLVFPGPHSRLHALTVVGRRMGAVVAGSVVMLALAAVVEGVFRQVVQSVPVRYVLAATFAALWCAYFVCAGRRQR
ncbi:MAG: stage II sporulation protein M [Planctomycetes bacterium]|nr:stage II sporulation protein M [Planctomycetota bacterium]